MQIKVKVREPKIPFQEIAKDLEVNQRENPPFQ